MIRQLSICCTSDGLIGFDGQLAFWSAEDMANFKKFTKRTVLIVGRVTANEMIGVGFKPTAERPMIVISANGCLDDEPIPHVYYAQSLDDAIIDAGVFANTAGLCGYTIIGGKSVYQEFFSSDHKIDVAYVATVDANQECFAEEHLKVKIDLPEGKTVCDLVNAKMLSTYSQVVEKTVVLSKPDSLKAKCRFEFIYDRMSFAPTAVRVTPAGFLKIKAVDGEHAFHLSTVTRYTRERERNAIRILANGHEFLIRLESLAEINFLHHTLDQLV
jgi:dihydrofolate reductase